MTRQMSKHQTVIDLERALRSAAAKIECRDRTKQLHLRETMFELKEKASAAERYVKDFDLDSLWEFIMTLENWVEA